MGRVVRDRRNQWVQGIEECMKVLYMKWSWEDERGYVSDGYIWHWQLTAALPRTEGQLEGRTIQVMRHLALLERLYRGTLTITAAETTEVCHHRWDNCHGEVEQKNRKEGRNAKGKLQRGSHIGNEIKHSIRFLCINLFTSCVVCGGPVVESLAHRSSQCRGIGFKSSSGLPVWNLPR